MKVYVVRKVMCIPTHIMTVEGKMFMCLPAFGTKEEAEEFVSVHGGKIEEFEEANNDQG